MTVRLPAETKARLGDLARRTRRTSAGLAGEAIAAYVERELAIVEGIQRGLDDMHAGRTVPHEEVMKRLRATIERAKNER